MCVGDFCVALWESVFSVCVSDNFLFLVLSVCFMCEIFLYDCGSVCEQFVGCLE